jgi:hypothetical protein
MQYGPSAGLVNIRNWLTTLQSQVHKRETGNWAISLGSGSQDLMSKVSGCGLAVSVRPSGQRGSWGGPSQNSFFGVSHHRLRSITAARGVKKSVAL